MNLDRIGVKSAGNVIRNIDTSRKNPLPRVLTALGIRFVGERTAVFLAQAFGSMDAIERATLDELQQAEEVGPKVAEAVVQFFGVPDNRELVDRLRKADLQFTYAFTRPKGGPLRGPTFFLTGTLPTFSRQEAKQLIEQAGGKAAGAARKKTRYGLAREAARPEVGNRRALHSSGLPESRVPDIRLRG